VVDLAIGVIMGPFSGIVNSLVGDVIMPIIGAVTGVSIFELLRPAVVEGYGYDARRGKKGRRGIGLGEFPDDHA
jgi:large-conductance mechanosensitive channel